jgi:hypothetical protein
LEKINKLFLHEFHCSIDSLDYIRASSIDAQHYRDLVKPTENVGLWDLWQEQTLSARRMLTKKFASDLPTREIPDSSSGFLIVHHNYSGLAHEQSLARSLSFLRESGHKFDFKIVYLFGKREGPASKKAAELYGISEEQILFINATNYPDAGARLEKLSIDLAPERIVYITIFFMAFWVSLYVSHPNQCFYQMKYPPRHSGRITLWGGQRAERAKSFRLLNGDRWLQLSVLDTNLPASAFDARREADGYVNFGSISRIEKIRQEGFLDFVLGVLESNEQLRFLYTGRSGEDELLPLALRDHPRAKFLGWVDPADSIRQFDIYLEPFPWGGGDMTILALSSGIPYLTLDTPQNRRFGMYNFLSLVAHNSREAEFSFGKSIEQLKFKLIEMSRSFKKRESNAQAWKNIMLHYRAGGIREWELFLGLNALFNSTGEGYQHTTESK